MPNSFLIPREWLKPLLPRDPHEKHRVATSLELLFDLIFVVAIATAGQQLHHAMIHNHVAQGLTLYGMVFFALWWAWMNFSWFASAYDNDDALYRILTFVQIIGSLVIAAGIPYAFQQQDFDVIIIGYAIMRLGLVTQWFRVAKNDLARRKTALRYAFGIIIVQCGWLLFHFTPIHFSVYLFVLLAIAELCVPIFAEAANRTPWHAHHIAERYSLLTIIVLGESIVGCSIAISDALSNQRFSTELLFLMIGGLIMMFTMWWSYFDTSIAERLNSRKMAFTWGYGHFFVFISIAAIGAGLAAAVDVVSHEALISSEKESYFVAISLIIYTTSLYVLHELHHQHGLKKLLYPLTVVIVLCIPLLITPAGYAIFAMAVVYALRLMFSKCYLSQ
ncbi:low temperature requirement protein A [Acinetobacter sp. ANC 5054]|uniref:low temperature requirement protein A n=1 Tax=Acinetobacter sp. ANC 5054 TaxID=1977877 RepID=UPI000A35B0AC|nr:low temperature requirement protein A [Acinetobacter sp. ANC 5054]OTG78966.1 low temperature requirement protein A [Acinetobacter sp. ANC 5054]